SREGPRRSCNRARRATRGEPFGAYGWSARRSLGVREDASHTVVGNEDAADRGSVGAGDADLERRNRGEAREHGRPGGAQSRRSRERRADVDVGTPERRVTDVAFSE